MAGAVGQQLGVRGYKWRGQDYLGWLSKGYSRALDIDNAFVILALLASALDAGLQHSLVQIKNLPLGLWG